MSTDYFDSGDEDAACGAVAGCGGAMGAAGTGATRGGEAGTDLAGKYNGPVCPHAASKPTTAVVLAQAMNRRRWKGGFTITISSEIAIN